MNIDIMERILTKKDNDYIHNRFKLYEGCNHIIYHPTGDKHLECKLCGLNDFVLDRPLHSSLDEMMYNYLTKHPNDLKDAEHSEFECEHIYIHQSGEITCTCIKCGKTTTLEDDDIYCSLELARALYFNLLNSNPCMTNSDIKIAIKKELNDIRSPKTRR